MNRFYPHRNVMNPNRNARFLAFFWMYLATIFLLSFWS